MFTHTTSGVVLTSGSCILGAVWTGFLERQTDDFPSLHRPTPDEDLIRCQLLAQMAVDLAPATLQRDECISQNGQILFLPILRAFHDISRYQGKMLRFCLDVGIDLESRDREGSTALLAAMRSPWDNSVEYVNLLIRYGADVSAVNDLGRNVFHQAALGARDLALLQHLTHGWRPSFEAQILKLTALGSVPKPPPLEYWVVNNSYERPPWDYLPQEMHGFHLFELFRKQGITFGVPEEI